MKLRFKLILHLLFFSLLIAASGGRVCSQGFVKTFGGPYIQVGYGVHELENGEIVVVAEEIWDPTAPHYITKWYRLSSTGELLSEKEYFGFGMAFPRKMVALGNDRFVVVGGGDRSATLNPRPFVAEFNADGIEQWKILLEYLNGDSSSATFGTAMDVDTVPGGGILVTAETFSFPPIRRRSNLVKLDDFGNIVWVKQDTGLGFGNFAQSVVDAEGYIYTAITSSVGFQEPSKIVLSKRNPEGKVLWRKILDLDPLYSGIVISDILIDPDSKLVLGGISKMDDGDWGLIFAKYSSEGQKSNESHIKAEGWTETVFRDFCINDAGDFIIVGEGNKPGDQQSPSGYYDGLMMILSPNFDVKRTKLFNASTSSREFIAAIEPTRNNHFLLAGRSSGLPGNVDSEVLLAKVNCFGDVVDQDIPDQSIDLLAYPVPSASLVTLSAETSDLCLDRLTDLNLEVFNTLGQKVVVNWRFVGGKVLLDFSETAPGHYFVTLKSEMGDLRTKKIRVNR
jgi:hypothetical protein